MANFQEIKLYFDVESKFTALHSSKSWFNDHLARLSSGNHQICYNKSTDSHQKRPIVLRQNITSKAGKLLELVLLNSCNFQTTIEGARVLQGPVLPDCGIPPQNRWHVAINKPVGGVWWACWWERPNRNGTGFLPGGIADVGGRQITSDCLAFCLLWQVWFAGWYLEDWCLPKNLRNACWLNYGKYS